MLESNARYAVTFLDEKKDSCKLVLENCNYESASATHAPYNSQQNVSRCNVSSSWCNMPLGQRWAKWSGKICSVVMTPVLSFSRLWEHKIPISSMRRGVDEAVVEGGNQAGMGMSDQMLVHFANKSVSVSRSHHHAPPIPILSRLTTWSRISPLQKKCTVTWARV